MNSRVAASAGETSSLIFLLMIILLLSFLLFDVFAQSPNDFCIKRSSMLLCKLAHALKNVLRISCPVWDFFFFVHASIILLFRSHIKKQFQWGLNVLSMHTFAHS